MTTSLFRLHRILRLLADAWKSAVARPLTAGELQTQDSAIALRVLKRRARGNISLKKGKILTAAFLAERKQLALHRDFSR